VRFLLAAGLLLGAYYFPYDPRGFVGVLFRLYLTGYAHLAGAAIHVFDPGVHVEGTRIVGRGSLEFALSCDAMDVLCLFASATYAFPASWRARAAAIAGASVAMLGINVTRLVVLYFIQVYAPARFELFHMQIFPLAIVVLATLGFLAWAGPRGRGEGRHAVVAA
jgi:exosortase/archaeosortase family protein